MDIDLSLFKNKLCTILDEYPQAGNAVWPLLISRNNNKQKQADIETIRRLGGEPGNELLESVKNGFPTKNDINTEKMTQAMVRELAPQIGKMFYSFSLRKNKGENPSCPWKLYGDSIIEDGKEYAKAAKIRHLRNKHFECVSNIDSLKNSLRRETEKMRVNLNTLSSLVGEEAVAAFLNPPDFDYEETGTEDD